MSAVTPPVAVAAYAAASIAEENPLGTAAVALVFLAAAIEHYSRWNATLWSRMLLAAGAILMIAPDLWLSAMGAALGALKSPSC